MIEIIIGLIISVLILIPLYLGLILVLGLESLFLNDINQDIKETKNNLRK